MGKGRSGRAVRGGAAAALAAGLCAALAPAAGEGYTILTHISTLAPVAPIGVGGDGSLVFYSSFFSIVPTEDAIDAEALTEKPFLSNNLDLFRWDATRDEVTQFTATANVENSGGDSVLFFTGNGEPSVESRTVDLFQSGGDTLRKRLEAIAFTSNADQTIPGPSTTVDDVDARVAALGQDGSTIYVWDSERQEFNSVFEFFLSPVAITLSQPSLAMKSRTIVDPTVRGNGDDRATDVEIRDVLVAFAGDANPAGDNFDANQEIFLWSRRAFLEDGEPGGGGLRNGGVQQITHTLDGDSSTPAVNVRGEIAFVSTADITGENPDGGSEMFVWRGGSIRQITNSGAGTFGSPRWSANGNVLVFHATGDLVRKNPDQSSEIFTWDHRRLRQITAGTSGGSSSPSVDSRGRLVAFVSNADIGGLAPATLAPEVVVVTRGVRTVRQLTYSEDGFANEAPILTGGGLGAEVTWVSSSNLDGRNSNNTRRIYRTRVADWRPSLLGD